MDPTNSYFIFKENATPSRPASLTTSVQSTAAVTPQVSFTQFTTESPSPYAHENHESLQAMADGLQTKPMTGALALGTGKATPPHTLTLPTHPLGLAARADAAEHSPVTALRTHAPQRLLQIFKESPLREPSQPLPVALTAEGGAAPRHMPSSRVHTHSPRGQQPAQVAGALWDIAASLDETAAAGKRSEDAPTGLGGTGATSDAQGEARRSRRLRDASERAHTPARVDAGTEHTRVAPQAGSSGQRGSDTGGADTHTPTKSASRAAHMADDGTGRHAGAGGPQKSASSMAPSQQAATAANNSVPLTLPILTRAHTHTHTPSPRPAQPALALPSPTRAASSAPQSTHTPSHARLPARVPATVAQTALPTPTLASPLPLPRVHTPHTPRTQLMPLGRPRPLNPRAASSPALGPLASLLSPSARTYAHTHTQGTGNAAAQALPFSVRGSGPIGGNVLGERAACNATRHAAAMSAARHNGADPNTLPQPSPGAPSLLSFLSPPSHAAAQRPQPSPFPHAQSLSTALSLSSPLSSPLLTSAALPLPLALTPLPRPSLSPPPPLSSLSPLPTSSSTKASVSTPLPLALRAAALLPRTLPARSAFALLAHARTPNQPALLAAAAHTHVRLLRALRTLAAAAALAPPRYTALWRVLTCRGIREVPRGAVRGAYRGAVRVWGEPVPCAGALASRVCRAPPHAQDDQTGFVRDRSRLGAGAGSGAGVRVQVDYLSLSLVTHPHAPTSSGTGAPPVDVWDGVASEEEAAAALAAQAQLRSDRDDCHTESEEVLVSALESVCEAPAQSLGDATAHTQTFEAVNAKDNTPAHSAGGRAAAWPGNEAVATACGWARGQRAAEAAWRAVAVGNAGMRSDEGERVREGSLTRRGRKRARANVSDDEESRVLGYGVPAVRCAQWYASYAAAAARLVSSGVWASAEGAAGIGSGGRWLRALASGLEAEVRAAERARERK